jgi:hypothetical protein
METGFFTMDTVHAVLSHKDLVAAQTFLRSIVQEAKTARGENVRKAMNMVNNAKSVQSLGLAVTNFLLAHPSENLKTI